MVAMLMSCVHHYAFLLFSSLALAGIPLAEAYLALMIVQWWVRYSSLQCLRPLVKRLNVVVSHPLQEIS
jgi:hypothetical protein